MSALLVVVYSRVSDALLIKSEELLQTTTGKTFQETSAWMNRTLTMLETQRDTIEYGDMDIPERAKNYAEKFHVPAWYTSIDEPVSYTHLDVYKRQE